MGRHTKATVDYFPHYVHHGKTLHIIQNLYGNDGYAFFYKLLETLGDAEGHYYDCRDETSKEFLAAQTHVEWITGAEILNKLCSMRIIDPELWKIEVIWMDSFVDSVKDAYRKRAISVPVKPQVSVFLPPEMQDNGISTAGSTQSKVKKSKEEKDMPESGLSLFDSFYQKYPVKKAKQEAIKAWNKLKPENGTVQLILSAIQKQKDANETSKKKGEFVPEWPYPATWLNGRRWEDVIQTTTESKISLGLSPDEEKFLNEQEERERG